MAAIDREIDARARPRRYGSLHAQQSRFPFPASIVQPGSSVLLPLVESLWLQVGPSLRMVVGRLGTGYVVDRHQAAIRAIRARDEAALREAIRADILDGQEIIGRDILMRQRDLIVRWA